jgi:hypothetical protein
MEQREKKVKEKVEQEDRIESMQLNGIRQFVWDILTKEKNFLKEEIQIDPVFPLLLNDCEAQVSIDFVIHLPTASFMVIRCASVSMESWERYVVSFARVIKEYQIPYAVITDGENTRVIDVLSGSVLDMSLHNLFTREDAMKQLETFKRIPYPADKAEKTKRILYAFEGIKCPTSKESKDHPE